MSTLPAPAYQEDEAEAPDVAVKAGLIFMIEANLVELRNCSDLERRRELNAGIEIAVRRLANDEIAHHLSFIIARGVQPAHEKLSERGCPFKNLRHNTALTQQVKLQGYGVCPHCSRIIVK
jgi:hypothetical protein